jgi:hypothetical protein
VFQSNYDMSGLPVQYLDGTNVTASSGKVVVVKTNISLEAFQYFREGKGLKNIFDPSHPTVVNLVQSSMVIGTSQKPLRRTVVYEQNQSANEICLGYYVLPEGVEVKTLDDIGEIIIIIPRARVLTQGVRLPIIGGGCETVKMMNPMVPGQFITVVSEVKSYDFQATDRLGFVAFVRCWSPTDGLVIDWTKAFFTDAQLNPDFNARDYTNPGVHFAMYTRDSTLLTPVTSQVQYFSLEDTRTDWKSDRDFNDLGFQVVEEPFSIQVHAENPARTSIDHAPDISLDINGTTCFVGSPQDNQDRGSVFVYSRPNQSSFDWNLVQKIEGPDGFTQWFGSVIASTVNRTWLVIGSPNGIGSFYIYKLQDNEYVQNAKFVGQWPSCLLGKTMCINTSGTTLFASVSNSGSNDCGFIYRRTSEDNWTFQQRLKLPESADTTIRTGFSATMSGDGLTIVMGSSSGTLSNGAVWFYTFDESSGLWSNPVDISVFVSSSNAEIGKAVALNTTGSLLAVSAPSQHSASGPVTVLLNRTSFSTFDQTDTLQTGPPSLPSYGTFSAGSYLKICDDGLTLVAASKFQFDDSINSVSYLIVLKKLASGWTVVQSPLLSGLETAEWFRSPKFALSNDGMVLVGRDVRANSSTVGNIVFY